MSQFLPVGICSRAGAELTSDHAPPHNKPLNLTGRLPGWERNPPPKLFALRGRKEVGFPNLAPTSIFLEWPRRRSPQVMGHSVMRHPMFARLRAKVREWRSFGTKRDEAWAPLLVVREDGRTLFQEEAETRIVALLKRRGLRLVNRRVEGGLSSRHSEADSSAVVAAEIPQLGARLWLYEDQTEVSTPGRKLNLERWGFMTPEEHISVVEKFLEELIDAPDAA